MVTIALWTIFYLTAFCYTSYTIAKQLKLCASAVFGKNKAKQHKLFKLGCKLLFCTFTSMFTTLISAVIYSVVVNARGGYYFLCSLNIMDFLINSICLALQWNVFDLYYRRYCSLCDKCIAKCYRYSLDEQQIIMANSESVAQSQMDREINIVDLKDTKENNKIDSKKDLSNEMTTVSQI